MTYRFQPSPLAITFAILRSYNRRRELIRLCKWAERKRLKHPLRLYRFRLQDEEIRLTGYQLRYPKPAQWAYLLHRFNTLVFGEPRFLRKKMGAPYRRRSITVRSEKGVS